MRPGCRAYAPALFAAPSTRRTIHRYEDDGLDGLIDKRLARVSHRRAPVDEVMRPCLRQAGGGSLPQPLGRLGEHRHKGWNVEILLFAGRRPCQPSNAQGLRNCLFQNRLRSISRATRGAAVPWLDFLSVHIGMFNVQNFYRISIDTIQNPVAFYEQAT